jgi:hypothetical protein
LASNEIWPTLSIYDVSCDSFIADNLGAEEHRDRRFPISRVATFDAKPRNFRQRLSLR